MLARSSSGSVENSKQAQHDLPEPRRGFEEDRAQLGLLAAVDRLRYALAYNGLTLDSDQQMLAGALEGSVSSVELAEAICSPRRMDHQERLAPKVEW